MSSVPSSRVSRTLVATAVVALVLPLAGALTACATPFPSASPAPTATALNTAVAAESSQTPTAAVPTATPTTAPNHYQPVTSSCADLLTDQFVFEIGPNFARASDYTPDAGSTDAFIAGNQGVACRVINLSGGDYIDVAVAKMDAPGIADLISNLSSAQAEVSDFGGNVRGFFTDANGVAQASAVTDKYWVVVSSPLFSQARDAAPIVSQVLAKLG